MEDMAGEIVISYMRKESSISEDISLDWGEDDDVLDSNLTAKSSIEQEGKDAADI